MFLFKNLSTNSDSDPDSDPDSESHHLSQDFITASECLSVSQNMNEFSKQISSVYSDGTELGKCRNQILVQSLKGNTETTCSRPKVTRRVEYSVRWMRMH